MTGYSKDVKMVDIQHQTEMLEAEGFGSGSHRKPYFGEKMPLKPSGLEKRLQSDPCAFFFNELVSGNGCWN